MSSKCLEDALLLALTHKVRFLSLPQIARTFWSHTTETAVRNHLDRMARTEMIKRVSIVTHPELPLMAPIFQWKPGDIEPDYGALSYRCRLRWSRPLVSLPVWKASPRAVALCGGLQMPLHRAQASHDLHVGALYCHLWRNTPTEAAQWHLEDSQIALPEERLPDGLLIDEMQTLKRVLEFGGACKPARIQKLHAFGVCYDVPYELW